MLVVGGCNRVYETGCSFRNEGSDKSHNPEFSMCEFYMAYADYNDLIGLTESLLYGFVMDWHWTHKIRYQPNKDNFHESTDIDFSPPFKRLYVIPELEKHLGVRVPPPDTHHTTEAQEYFQKLCMEHKIVYAEPRITTRLLDKASMVLFMALSGCQFPTVFSWIKFASANFLFPIFL